MEIKIPFYNILNMLLTGLVFSGCYVLIDPDWAITIFKNEIIHNLTAGPEIVITVCFFAITYEIGLIINRFGSLVIEYLMKKIPLIPFNDNYVLFNDKKKEYPIMDILSREYALSRTGISLFFILSIIALIRCRLILALVFFTVSIIYFFSCRKHASKIVKLMNSNKTGMKPQQENNNESKN